MIPVPFRLDFSHLAVDDTVSFCVSVLLAITINAEGQAFMATFLGDASSDSKDRFHFNPLFHIDIFGLICFFTAGFGWSKKISVNTEKFDYPRFFTVLTAFGGAIANFLLASIAGSIIWVMGSFGIEDRVFSILIAVNLMTAVYNILPIPPLAGSALISVFFPYWNNHQFQRLYYLIGAIMLTGICFADRFIMQGKILSIYMDPLVIRLFNFIIKT